jgi:diguanylate cyclase (GGDEF)-like protein
MVETGLAADGSADRRVRLALPSPATRVWAFSLGLAVLAAALEIGVVIPHSGLPPATLPWPLIAAAFCIAETKVVIVHFRREQHSFSLSEFPAVIGLFILTPTEYLLALLVGSGAALLIARQPPLKLTFNLVNFGLGGTAALAVFHTLAANAGTPSPADWIAAFSATLVTTLLSSLCVATAISLSGGAPQFQKLPQMIQFGGLAAAANTSLALLAVSILWIDWHLLWLLAVPLVIVFLAYRAYLSEREKGERLEFLYQSGRILQHSPELDSAIVALLDHAREMFRAELAEVLLYPRQVGDEALRTRSLDGRPPLAMEPVAIPLDDPIARRIRAEAQAFFFNPADTTAPGSTRQAMVAPLRGESGVIGSLVIGHRLTEGTSFTDDDLRLLETLANQAAIALENGQLEQSLSELSRLKEQLRYQAYHDPLTGLANRSLFVEQVNERLGAPGNGTRPVVLFIDLDDFKVVNDTLGHGAGDQLLVAVADRVKTCIRGGDLAARLGGDEFALLLEDRDDLALSVEVCRRVLDALQLPVQIRGQEISVSASIGMAAARSENDRADELLRNADVAMYTAKADGKGRYAAFEPTMHAALVERHALASELSKSVGRGELLVHYQPIVALADGATYGVEALVRWRHPMRGIIGPDEFIPLAHESGAILALGRWVLSESCREAASWRRDLGIDHLILSVNLSALQLQQVDFVEDLESILGTTGFPAEDLVLELTESAMFHDTQTTITRLEALRALGIRIAIDDFGTGYSSLAYLRRFRVDILKIAREFIGQADGRSDDWAFAKAMVALGDTLGLRVIAEGIEDEGQLAVLQALGCEFGQGYLFARPDTPEAVAARLLADRSARDRPIAAPAAARGPAPSVRARNVRPAFVAPG